MDDKATKACDDDDDEQQSEQQTTSRRISVFNKTFDPEAAKSTSSSSTASRPLPALRSSESGDDDELASLATAAAALRCRTNSKQKHSITSGDSDSSTADDFEALANRVYESAEFRVKDGEKLARLKSALRDIMLFKHLYEEDLDELARNMYTRPTSAQELIIREGDQHANYFYMIGERGSYEIYKRQLAADKASSFEHNSEHGYKVHVCDKYGEYFGELALLYGQPRSATVVSRDDNGILYFIHRNTFQRLVIDAAFQRRQMYEKFLESVPLLQASMSHVEMSRIADALKSIRYEPGECIFKQDEPPNGMYFIESGAVDVVEKDGKSVIAMLSTGDYFGECALVNKTMRSASVYVNKDRGACRVAFLDIDAFERLMGPCVELIKSKINTYKHKV